MIESKLMASANCAAQRGHDETVRMIARDGSWVRLHPARLVDQHDEEQRENMKVGRMRRLLALVGSDRCVAMLPLMMTTIAAYVYGITDSNDDEWARMKTCTPRS